MLEGLKSTIRQWREEVDSLEQQLEVKLQRLAYLEEAPLPPDEIADDVINTMLRHAQTDFSRHLKTKLAPAIDNPLRDTSQWAWRPGLMTKLVRTRDVDPGCLLWLLRDPISAAIREEILNWPELPKAGPPRAEREKELPKLRNDIERLQGRIDAEREAAKSIAEGTAQIHQRDPVPTRPRDLKRQPGPSDEV